MAEGLLECSVCLGTLDEPCTLPCGHTFCLGCIQSVLQTTARRKCPLCNAAVPFGTPLKVNVLARELVAAMLEKQRQREAEQDCAAAAAAACSEAAAPAGSPLPSLQQAASSGARSLEQQLREAAEGSVVAAPSIAVQGPRLQLNASAADSIEACSELCRTTTGCDWFWYCDRPGGCADGSGGTLPLQGCQLLGEACTLPALGLSGTTGVQVTSGFPADTVFGDQSFKFTELQGQGIEGEDFPCDASSVPGKCVLPVAGEATLVCHFMGRMCQAVTVYLNDPFFLYEHEATVQAPTAAEMAANEASLAENGTAWWGCASAQCVASGADVAVLDNVASAEDCCHACAERLDGTPTAIQTGQPCNAWNYCDKPDGCSFAGSSVSPAPLRLSYRQCQLRYAFLSNITYGAPLIVGAKGNASEFTCGAPLSFAAPDLPGFTRMPGRGLFLYGNYNCTPSLRPGWDCAPPSNNLTELAKGCLEDPQCLAMPIKQAQPTVNGFYNASSPYKGFRKKENAKLLIVPTTNLYIPQGRAASSSSLSAAVTYCRWPNGQPQEIGVGATSRVYRAMLNGEMVAAKEIDLASGESCQLKQEAFITEALRLQQLRHPNVVGLMGIALTPRRGVLLLEYCQGRDLHAALDVLALGTQERLFGWHRRGKRVALEVAKALNFLHSKGIVHLDVKSPNVLLTENGTAKLADVGFSREKLHTFLSDLSNFGTFAWAAPELLLARQCTQKVDIYSWGVLLWEIVTGERPQRGQLRLPRVPEECPQAASDLLLQCLHQDPAQRPTALELMQRLEPLVGPPKHALPEVGGGSGVLTTAAPAGGLMVCPSMRVAVPPAGIPSPFAALAAIALPSSQQHQLPSPFTAQAAAACASRQQQQQWGQEEERQDE
ncbi:Serine threonine- kinase CTR1 [Chlorella sorokiniana]|uniref:non-specific serine/threonine protein kinase n=1 Tax=Chlorella sorokiniana TaxID=3076 RepID=A0A2P6TUI8_CHLSO|nr:Serine threonine- kinase CTR1 [Chlorella sorokiniana]|eukprot:PRW57729.1 Serine threonine- kinase CTR1 [Chlorella sorokiniana]